MPFSAGLRCICDGRPGMAPIELEPGLAAMSCTSCRGTALSMTSYREWQRGQPLVSEALPVGEPHNASDASARQCAACNRLMERLKVTPAFDFRLDRCGACQIIWLDEGEWLAIAAAGISAQLDAVLSDRGQREIREQEQQAARAAHLREKYGEDCLTEMTRIRAWLDVQPDRDVLIALLRSGW